MAVIASYTNLLTEVANWLARSDLTSDIPGFVQNWEEEFYNDSENWGAWMETALNVTITNGVAALPNDYLGLKVAYISGAMDKPLKRISLEQLYMRYPRASTGGSPGFIARNGANFEFGPNGASGTLAGTYFAKPALLRNVGGGANYLITNEPHLCLYGSMAQAELFTKNDARNLTWAPKYDRALVAYRMRMNREEYSGAAPHSVVV